MDLTALFSLSYGLYIAASKDGGRDVGCVVNSAFQVTSSPPTLALSINKENYTTGCILSHGSYTLSVLSENADKKLIGAFGFFSSRDRDKFASSPRKYTASGLAYIADGAAAYLECKVIQHLDFYTHTLILSEIIGGEKLSDDPPMTYDYYHKVIKGKAPKNAPTYVKIE